MRVLHVISDSNIGGAGVLLTTLLRGFDPARVQSVVALPAGSELFARVRALDIPTVTLRERCDRGSLASIAELTRVIRLIVPDILHTNAAVSARIAGKIAGVRVVHTRHCCFSPEGIWRVGAARAVGGALNRMLSDRVIATAEAAERNLCELGIPREKIDVIPNGSFPVRSVTPAEKRAFAASWGIGKGDFPVGICARLERYKGQETFLRAAKIAIERDPERRFVFLLAGEGSDRERLEGLALSLGIGERTRFLGFLGDTAPFYRALRINVNCSSGTETSCLALSEGMSAGVPCVVSDYGGNPAMLGESGAGILVPVGDAEAVADAIVRIASDLDLETRMKRAALERYAKEYTADGMVERVTRVYEELMKEKKAKEKSIYHTFQ